MNEKQAREIVEGVKRVDECLMQLETLFDDLEPDEKRLLRKGLGQVILEIYDQIEGPIYKQYPNLPNRRDM